MVRIVAILLLVSAIFATSGHAAQLTACVAGVTNCSADTTNDQLIFSAINDSATQTRVWNLWNGQCNNIYSEAVTTTGHSYRVNFCQSIADSPPGAAPGTQRVPPAFLVSVVMDSTVVSEVLAGASPGAAAGNMVDADVNTAIDAALTVDSGGAVSAVATTITGTSGNNFFTVGSATGITAGQGISAAGVPNGATVLYVSGTTVYMNQALTSSPSGAAVVFLPIAAQLYGLPVNFP